MAKKLTNDILELENKLQRSLADYQNLVRRTQEEKRRWVKLATQDFVEELIQPLDHLTLAAQQLGDSGLDMVVQELWQALEIQGLRKTEALGEEFDPTTMEATDKKGDGQTVIEVQSDGYSLNGEVIKHAKVVVGKKDL